MAFHWCPSFVLWQNQLGCLNTPWVSQYLFFEDVVSERHVYSLLLNHILLLAHHHLDHDCGHSSLTHLLFVHVVGSLEWKVDMVVVVVVVALYSSSFWLFWFCWQDFLILLSCLISVTTKLSLCLITLVGVFHLICTEVGWKNVYHRDSFGKYDWQLVTSLFHYLRLYW